MLTQNEKGILLESGTNEIMIMEFTIDGNLYGINVAKVKEILNSAPYTVKPMPHAHPAVEGIFKPRDIVLTVVDLPRYLRASESRQEKDLFIITNFNKMNIAFRVHTVVGIRTISWTDIQKPDDTISGGEEGVATGIAQCDGDLVTILDFEKIVTEIAPQTGIQLSEIEKMGYRECREMPVLVAEDSILLTKMIGDALNKSGYVNVTMFPDGLALWNRLQQAKQENNLKDVAALVITDIEMPQMDGHRLTKLIKDDPVLTKLPVIIFSSLVTDEMRIKGKQLGADEQLSKPEIGHLVDVMDQLLAKR